MLICTCTGPYRVSAGAPLTTVVVCAGVGLADGLGAERVATGRGADGARMRRGTVVGEGAAARATAVGLGGRVGAVDAVTAVGGSAAPTTPAGAAAVEAREIWPRWLPRMLMPAMSTLTPDITTTTGRLTS
jgi:hypothetical protein